jgi:tripartite-type tricarboxylate transporter receptor subunit TctC
LASTGAKRDPAASEVLTIEEGGVPGYEVTGWQALFVPAKTPSEIVCKISADTGKQSNGPKNCASQGSLAGSN